MQAPRVKRLKAPHRPASLCRGMPGTARPSCCHARVILYHGFKQPEEIKFINEAVRGEDAACTQLVRAAGGGEGPLGMQPHQGLYLSSTTALGSASDRDDGHHT